MAKTKKEVYDSLTAELQKVYDDANECFGKEHDTEDKTCGECADITVCGEIFNAEEVSEASSPEASTEDEAPEVKDEEKVEVPSETEAQEETTIPAKEETQMAEDAKKEEVKEEAKEEPTKEADGEKKTPAGFGDRTAKKDEFGFTESTKGSYIAQLIKEGLYTKTELIEKTGEKFGTDSRGRVNMVLYRLRTKGFDLQKVGKRYYLKGVTPDDLVEAAQKKLDDALAAEKKKEEDATAEKKKATEAEKKPAE